MSFTFNWPRFSDQFHYDTIQMLNTALNKGNKPPIIADKIEVVELEMGTQPPELEIRDIGDLTVDQFRGIFRLTYNGDAHLVLKTKVQANPLNHKLPDIHQLSGSTGMLAAKQPLVVPMLLRLSHFRLSSYVVLVVSKQKGITIVFKTDPLQNVDINSTFDSIAVIQNFIQREIEGQLRQLFREDLPSIIHRLSQQWVKAKVETPYKKQNQDSLRKLPPPLETMSNPDLSRPPPRRWAAGGGAASDVQPRPPLAIPRRARSTAGASSVSSPLAAPPINNSNSQSSSIETSSFPDLEHFDPTYGLRPEGLPTKPIFKGFSKLFAPSKGLAGLAEEASTVSGSAVDDDSDYLSSGSVSDAEEDDFYDFVDWGGAPSEPPVEYETIPAIGGGTITRPRVVHAQSQIQSPASPSSSRLTINTALSGRSGGLAAASPGLLQRTSSNPYIADRMSGFRHGLQSPPLSAPPTSNPTRRHYHSPSSLGPDDAVSSRGGPRPTQFTHPYDLEHRDNDEDDLESEYRPSRYQRTNDDYFSARAGSMASSPPRPSSSSKRRLSISSHTTARTSMSGRYHDPHSPSSHDPGAAHNQDPTKIVLRPSLMNNSIHHLSTLSHSNHTLSPYTRSFEHFAVRSGPPRAQGSSASVVGRVSASSAAMPGGGASAGIASTAGSIGRSKGLTTTAVGLGAASRPGKGKADVVVKARRKRIFRLGGKKDPASAESSTPGVVPSPGDTSVDDGESDYRDVRDERVNLMYRGSTVGVGVAHGRSLGSRADGHEGLSHGKGKMRARQRRRRNSFDGNGTDFDEADMDRYFKSMQDAEDDDSVMASRSKERR